MPRHRRPHPFYDPKRPASLGRWIVTTKQGCISRVESFRTEAEARKAMGLRGGSIDPLYRPEEARHG